MAEPELEPTLDNVADLMQRRAMIEAASVYDDDKQDPERAARAIQLSKVSGVPAGVIHEDQDNFEKQGIQRATRDIVRNNPYIQDYINSHPLAAKVSSDDWGAMSKTSESALKMGAKSILGKAFEGFKEGFNRQSIDEETQKLSDMISPYIGGPLREVVLSDARDLLAGWR